MHWLPLAIALGEKTGKPTEKQRGGVIVLLANIGVEIAWFAGAFVFASLAEYWMHRLMHVPPKHPIRRILPNVGQVHHEHHRRNEGQGVLGEFTDYLKGAFILMCAGFLVSIEAGICWLLGAVCYAAFAAYAHQLQHENPRACFWMKMPVHYVHHKYNQWHHNFGLGVDWWDRVFGTYCLVEWLSAEEQTKPIGGRFQLKWR